MHWHQVREHYPSQWVLVEALQAHSEAGRRRVEELAVIRAFTVTLTEVYLELASIPTILRNLLNMLKEFSLKFMLTNCFMKKF